MITGASSGFGEEFARQLAPHVARLILVARRVERMEAIKADLLARHPHLDIHIHPVDLSDRNACDAFCREVVASGVAVDVLVNNAGLGDLGKFQSSDREKNRDILEVNIAAPTALCHALLPLLKRGGRGAILNVSSFSAILPMPSLAVYAATKAYVDRFSEALRIELRKSGVRVVSVCPGPVDTGFGAVASRKGTKDLPVPTWLKVPVGQVVGEALEAVACNRARVFPGFAVKLLALWVSILPLPVLRRTLPLMLK